MDGEGVALATAIATAVATSVSLLVSLWWRWADRKEPDWIALSASTKFGNGPNQSFEYSHVACQLTNVGDATAFRVRARGYGCKATLGVANPGRPARGEPIELVSAIPSGAAIPLKAWAMPEMWPGAFVVVTWVVSPTRRRSSRRSTRIRLEELSPPPSFSVAEMGQMDIDGSIPIEVETEVPEDFDVPRWMGSDHVLPDAGPSWFWAWRAERRTRAEKLATRRDISRLP